MKIQFAIDGITLGQGINLANKIRKYLDIIEIGDGTLMRYSNAGITILKDAFPEKKILADCKIMDGGYGQGMRAFDAGADIVTCCLVSDPECSRGLVRAAKEAGKESWLDLIGVDPKDYHKYVDFVNEVQPDYVCPHLSGGMFRGEAGVQARKDAMKLVSTLGFKTNIVLSGGLTLEYLPEILACHPHHINLGGALLKAEDPVSVAKAFYEA